MESMAEFVTGILLVVVAVAWIFHDCADWD